MLNFSRWGRLLQMTWRTSRASSLPGFNSNEGDTSSDALGHCADDNMPSHLGFAVVVDAVGDREFRFTEPEVTVQARPRTDKLMPSSRRSDIVDGVLQELRRRAKFIGIEVSGRLRQRNTSSESYRPPGDALMSLMRQRD